MWNDSHQGKQKHVSTKPPRIVAPFCLSLFFFVAVSVARQSRGKHTKVAVSTCSDQIMFLSLEVCRFGLLQYGISFPVVCFRSTRCYTPLTQVRRKDHKEKFCLGKPGYFKVKPRGIICRVTNGRYSSEPW